MSDAVGLTAVWAHPWQKPRGRQWWRWGDPQGVLGSGFARGRLTRGLRARGRIPTHRSKSDNADMQITLPMLPREWCFTCARRTRLVALQAGDQCVHWWRDAVRNSAKGRVSRTSSSDTPRPASNLSGASPRADLNSRQFTTRSLGNDKCLTTSLSHGRPPVRCRSFHSRGEATISRSHLPKGKSCDRLEGTDCGRPKYPDKANRGAGRKILVRHDGDFESSYGIVD